MLSQLHHTVPHLVHTHLVLSSSPPLGLWKQLQWIIVPVGERGGEREELKEGERNFKKHKLDKAQLGWGYN